MFLRALAAAIALACASLPASAQPAALYLDIGGHCSAFYLGGLKLATAGHCVDRSLIETVKDGAAILSKTFYVEDDNGVEIASTNKVAAFSADDDLAVLALAEPLDIAPVDLDCGDVAIGQDVSIVGYPGPLGYVATFGKVAGMPRRLSVWQSVFAIDTKADSGNSGGPVYDTATGKVVGILVGLATPNRSSYPLAAPASALCRMLGQ